MNYFNERKIVERKKINNTSVSVFLSLCNF